MGLSKQVTINTIYRVGFLVFQFLNTVLISRLIGPAGFGVYSLLVVNANLLLVFSSLGIPAGILFHASSRDLSLRKMMRISWLSTILQVGLVALIEIIHHGLSGSFWTWPSTEWLAGISGIVFFMVIVVTEKYYALYNGFHRFPLYNLITLIFNGLMFLVLLAFRKGAFKVTDETAVILAFIAIQLIQTILLVLIFHLRGIGRQVITETAGKEKNFLKYSIYAFLANAIFFLVTRVDFWILNYFKGETELGLYALASRMGQVFLVLPGLFAGIVLPALTARTMGTDKLESMLRILNSFNVTTMAILLVALPWLIPFMFGEEFRGSVWPIILLLPGIFFLAIQTLLAAYFASMGKPSVNVRSTIISFVVVLILDLLFIPWYGANGAALASSIAYAGGTFYSYYLYLGKENYKWHRLWMNRQDKQYFMQLLRRY